METVVVLIGGGHASGKRTAAHLLRDTLVETLPTVPLDIEIIDMETYLDTPRPEISFKGAKSIAITVDTNRDISKSSSKPSRYHLDKLRADILAAKAVEGQVQKIIIVHGLYALYDKELRQLADLKVFISGDPDTRLINWIRRDVVGGDKSLEDIIGYYIQSARDEMNDFIFPTKEFSDVILPSGPEQNAINLLVDGVVPYIDKEEKGHHLRLTPFLASGRYEENKSSFYELN